MFEHINYLGTPEIKENPHHAGKSIALFRAPRYNDARSLVALFNHHYFTGAVSWETPEGVLEKGKNHAFIYDWKEYEGVAINISGENEVGRIARFASKNQNLFAFVSQYDSDYLYKKYIADGVIETMKNQLPNPVCYKPATVDSRFLGKLANFFRS